MKDKSLGIWLAGFFGVPAIAVLLLAWLWAGLESDRFIAILVGAAGLLFAAVQVFVFFRPAGRAAERMTVTVEVEDRH